MSMAKGEITSKIICKSRHLRERLHHKHHKHYIPGCLQSPGNLEGQGMSGNRKMSQGICENGHGKCWQRLSKIFSHLPYNIEIFRSRLRRSLLILTDINQRLIVLSVSHIFGCKVHWLGISEAYGQGKFLNFVMESHGMSENFEMKKSYTP